jgi:hypothetical protein
MLRPGRRLSSNAQAQDFDGLSSNSSLDLSYGGAGFPPVASSGYGYQQQQQGYNTTAASTNNYENYSNALYKDKPARRGGSFLTAFVSFFTKQPSAIVAFVVMLSLLATCLSYRSQASLLLKELGVRTVKEGIQKIQVYHSDQQRLERDTYKYKNAERLAESKYKSLDKSHETLQNERDELRLRLLTKTDLSLKREDAFKNMLASLQNYTQRESRRAVLEKYGTPPYRVQVR